MDVLEAFLLTPLANMADDAILLRGAIGGLLCGVMYSLVALGFVLIYKAPGCSTLPRARWCIRRADLASG